MSVNEHGNRSARPVPAVKGGRHHIQAGISMPLFGRLGGTRTDYTVGAILARNGRKVAGEDEAGAR